MIFPETLAVNWWWYLLVGYLTIWSLGFGLWNFVNGQAMFKAFQIEFDVKNGVDEFIIKNSAARYLGIATALIVGVWLIGTPETAFVALMARLVMDIGDWIAGLQTGMLDNVVTGTLQSFAMFLAPNLIAIAFIFINL